ncbi:MAG: DUF4249 family protein [Bacteroidia bacterium]|nr:DUF4249 family protein [Bacteroidia bacterium]
MNRITLFIAGIFYLGISGVGCSTEVDLNAPEKDIWVVYGVLNPLDSVQYIRVSSGYLPTENALDYARANDLSVKGLKVTLSGGGKVYEAIETDSVAKEPADGIFYPFTTLYKIRTLGTDGLVPGQRYDLNITKPDNAQFELSSYTEVPSNMVFQNINPVPGGPGGSQRCLRRAPLEAEYKVEFSKGTGVGFEMRAFLRYQENQVEKSIEYGPTQMFDQNFRCTSSGGSSMCYQFREKELLAYLYNQVNPISTNVYTYGVNDQTRCNDNPANLPDDFRLEVTAMDRFLTNYRRANDPRFLDLNSVRPEYTNIIGPTDAEVIGIFGSVNSVSGSVRLSACAEYLLMLNNAPIPSEPCAL